MRRRLHRAQARLAGDPQGARARAAAEAVALALHGISGRRRRSASPSGSSVGAATPFLVAGIAAAALPYPLAPSIYPRELALGALYGLLTALAFSIAPLGRAHDLPVSALFRDLVAEDRGRPRWRYVGFALDRRGCARRRSRFVASPQKTVAVVVVVATAIGARRAALRRHRRDGAGAPRAAAAAGRGAARARQSASAGRADAFGRDFAWARPRGHRRAGAGRREHARTSCIRSPAAARRISIFSTCATPTPRLSANFSQRRGAGRESRRGADDARPHRQDRRRRRGRFPRQGERAMGAGGRSRRHLRRCAAAGLDGRRGPMVGQGLPGPAARLARIRDRRRARPARSAINSPSTCSAATSRRRSPICARSTGAPSRSISCWSISPSTFKGAPYSHAGLRRARRQAPAPSDELALMKATTRELSDDLGDPGARGAGRDRGAGRQAQHGDPLGGERRAGDLGADARRRARRQPARAHRRRGHPQSAGRDAPPPDGDISASNMRRLARRRRCSASARARSRPM